VPVEQVFLPLRLWSFACRAGPFAITLWSCACRAGLFAITSMVLHLWHLCISSMHCISSFCSLIFCTIISRSGDNSRCVILGPIVLELFKLVAELSKVSSVLELLASLAERSMVSFVLELLASLAERSNFLFFELPGKSASSSISSFAAPPVRLVASACLLLLKTLSLSSETASFR